MQGLVCLKKNLKIISSLHWESVKRGQNGCYVIIFNGMVMVAVVTWSTYDYYHVTLFHKVNERIPIYIL